MQESPDNLSVYGRIGAHDIPHCCCGKCKRCNARGASMMAIIHLIKLMPLNPPASLANKMASIFLSPGKVDISILIGYFREDFGEEVAETILQAAAEFRKCETIEEASEVAKKFTVPVITG